MPQALLPLPAPPGGPGAVRSLQSLGRPQRGAPARTRRRYGPARPGRGTPSPSPDPLPRAAAVPVPAAPSPVVLSPPAPFVFPPARAGPCLASSSPACPPFRARICLRLPRAPPAPRDRRPQPLPCAVIPTASPGALSVSPGGARPSRGSVAACAQLCPGRGLSARPSSKGGFEGALQPRRVRERWGSVGSCWTQGDGEWWWGAAPSASGDSPGCRRAALP